MESNKSYWRYALIASLSSGIAYMLASQIPHVSSIVAAITALIAVRPTFHASVKEGISQILAMILGALVALLVSVAVGFVPLALFGALFACFILAKALKMEANGIGIAISVLLVFGPHFDSGLIETRFLGVALGSLIALVGSFWTRPGKPHERALDAILSQEDAVARLLGTIADTLSKRRGDLLEGEVNAWLDEAKKIDRMIIEIRREAEDALTGHRFSPLVTEEDALAVITQVKIVQALVNTVQNIIRDLRIAARSSESIPAELAIHLSQAIRATSEAVAEQSDVAAQSPATHVLESREQLLEREENQRVALEHLRELDDSPFLIGGSVLADTNKINNIVTGR